MYRAARGVVPNCSGDRREPGLPSISHLHPWVLLAPKPKYIWIKEEGGFSPPTRGEIPPKPSCVKSPAIPDLERHRKIALCAFNWHLNQEKFSATEVLNDWWLYDYHSVILWEALMPFGERRSHSRIVELFNVGKMCKIESNHEPSTAMVTTKPHA